MTRGFSATERPATALCFSGQSRSEPARFCNAGVGWALKGGGVAKEKVAICDILNYTYDQEIKFLRKELIQSQTESCRHTFRQHPRYLQQCYSGEHNDSGPGLTVSLHLVPLSARRLYLFESTAISDYLQSPRCLISLGQCDLGSSDREPPLSLEYSQRSPS